MAPVLRPDKDAGVLQALMHKACLNSGCTTSGDAASSRISTLACTGGGGQARLWPPPPSCALSHAWTNKPGCNHFWHAVLCGWTQGISLPPMGMLPDAISRVRCVRGQQLLMQKVVADVIHPEGRTLLIHPPTCLPICPLVSPTHRQKHCNPPLEYMSPVPAHLEVCGLAPAALHEFQLGSQTPMLQGFGAGWGP